MSIVMSKKKMNENTEGAEEEDEMVSILLSRQDLECKTVGNLKLRLPEFLIRTYIDVKSIKIPLSVQETSNVLDSFTS